MRGPELRRFYDGHAQALFAFLLNLTHDEADTREAGGDLNFGGVILQETT